MRWTRANKAELASRIAELMGQDLSYRQIAQAVGKTRRRVLQVVKLFSLNTTAISGQIHCGKVPPQET